MPLIVGAKAKLKPKRAMKNNAEPDIITVFNRLFEWFSPSSPTSRNPTAIVIRKTSKAQSRTQRLLDAFATSCAIIPDPSVAVVIDGSNYKSCGKQLTLNDKLSLHCTKTSHKITGISADEAKIAPLRKEI